MFIWDKHCIIHLWKISNNNDEKNKNKAYNFRLNFTLKVIVLLYIAFFSKYKLQQYFKNNKIFNSLTGTLKYCIKMILFNIWTIFCIFYVIYRKKKVDIFLLFFTIMKRKGINNILLLNNFNTWKSQMTVIKI